MPHPFAAAATPRAAPPPIDLEARAARLPLSAMVSRRALLRLVPGEDPSLAFLHLRPDSTAMMATLGGAASGDVARHLAEALALRLLAGLADPHAAPGVAWGEDAPGLPATPPLLLDLPARAIQAGADAAAGLGWVAALALDTAADPLAFAALAGAARRQGWAVALRGLTAASLAWLRPGVLPADWFILDWSEALRDGALAAALHALAADRLILTGCDTDDALDWGLAHKIRIFGGLALDAWAARPGGRA